MLRAVDRAVRLMSGRWGLALHGGAGAVPRDLDAAGIDRVQDSLDRIVRIGGEQLRSGLRALDVVQEVVELLEDDAQFNAGHGSVLCRDGSHVLEAAIMDGGTGQAGAACLLRTIRHPIRAARLVMDHTSHVLLAGEDAEALAKAHGLEQVENVFFRTTHRAAALERMLAGGKDDGPHHATVGAVACDDQGNLAVATSTGGMTGKLPGRIGDTPLLGVGTWADASVAVSCTGRGEDFMRSATARHVADRMALAGASVEQATTAALQAMPEASGGMIAIDAHCNVAMPFTSAGMYRASMCDDGCVLVAIGP